MVFIKLAETPAKYNERMICIHFLHQKHFSKCGKLISQRSKILQSTYSQRNTLHIIAVVGVTVIIVNMSDYKVALCSLSAGLHSLSNLADCVCTYEPTVPVVLFVKVVRPLVALLCRQLISGSGSTFCGGVPE